MSYTTTVLFTYFAVHYMHTEEGAAKAALDNYIVRHMRDRLSLLIIAPVCTGDPS